VRGHVAEQRFGIGERARADAAPLAAAAAAAAAAAVSRLAARWGRQAGSHVQHLPAYSLSNWTVATSRTAAAAVVYRHRHTMVYRYETETQCTCESKAREECGERLLAQVHWYCTQRANGQVELKSGRRICGECVRVRVRVHLNTMSRLSLEEDAVDSQLCQLCQLCQQCQLC
jgi:hypothetical protein